MAKVIEAGKPPKTEAKEKTNAERDGVSEPAKAPEKKPEVKLFESHNKGDSIFECYIGHKTRGPKMQKEIKCAFCKSEPTKARFQFVIPPRSAKTVGKVFDPDADQK